MKILIVGAGLSGATLARRLAQSGHCVDIIDERNHVAGNAYDYIDESGIRIHKYGPHIFHTSNEKVINFLSNFTGWIPYKHKVRALLSDGRKVILPPNKNTAQILGDQLVEVIYRRYTKKMWGYELEEIDPSIINRIKIRNDDNEFYFPDDKFQFMPENGYTAMVEKMLEHSNIELSLTTDFNRSYEKDYDHIFNSMPIDKYYNYEHGELEYRSIKFKHVVLDQTYCSKDVTINFTHDGPFTRVTEWKNFPQHGQNDYKTVLTYEEPCDFRENNFERYYPVKDLLGRNKALYKKYKEIPNDKVSFIGRCGQYVYIDMHQAVNQALQIAEKHL